MLTRHKALKPGKPLAKGKGPSRRKPLRSSALKTVTTLKRSAPKHAAPKDTGFSAVVKLAVRARAGDGDPDQARCEATGAWLGRHGGEIQHRVARLSGGRGRKAPSWFHTAANAALLSRDAHRKCEDRDEHMHAAGWWLRSTQDASAEPVMLTDSSGGGITVWLTPDGQYSTRAPEAAA